MDVEENLRSWFPRDTTRRTNWLYHIDALRNHDIREMNLLWEISSLFLEQCQQFVVWASVIKHIIVNATDSIYLRHLERVYSVIIEIL